MTAAPDVNSAALSVLFAPAERWGWEFRPPPRPALSPERNEPPGYQLGEEIAVTWRRWRQRIEAFEAAQFRRVQQDPWWLSVQPSQPWSAVPIFGGTSTGWEALVTTLGATVLGSGSNMIVANLSEWAAAASLADLAAVRGVPVTRSTVSARESSIDLFDGLGSEELISVALSALATEDPGLHRREHMEDRALLRAIAVQLKPNVTLGRLRSALRILLREAPLTDQDAQLSSAEFDALTEMFGQEIRTGTDLLGRSYQLEHALEELSFFARLPVAAGEVGTEPDEGRGPRLSLYTVAHDMDVHEHDLGADLLLQRLLRALGDREAAFGGDDVLVICGADRIFQRTLDRLMALAERRRVRVVLLFARLRDNALAALGASDLCVFMRLSDYREAKEAAEQVGRSHRFVLSQVSRSRSESFDQGTSRSSGREQSRGTSSTFGGQFSSGRSSSVGESSSESTSASASSAFSQSESYERVYEFDLEPASVQALPATAFFLVEQARHACILADCDPTLALHPRLG